MLMAVELLVCLESFYRTAAHHIATICRVLQRTVPKREKKKCSSCVEENTLLMSGVRGQNGQTGWRPQKGNSNVR